MKTRLSEPKNIVEDIVVILVKVPVDYYLIEKLEVFNEVDSNTLLEYKPSINYRIDFEEGYWLEELGINPLYCIILRELEECWKYITENF